MTLSVREYRALEINTDNVGPEDVLHLMTQRGTPIMLTFTRDQRSCLRRWLYSREYMWPVDTCQVDDIIEAAIAATASETPHAFSTATFAVYTALHVALDKPLICTVEASWSDGVKTTLGTFESGGGLVKSAFAATPVTARV